MVVEHEPLQNVSAVVLGISGLPCLHACLRQPTHLLAHATVRDIVPRLDLADVHDDAHELISALPRQLHHLLSVGVPRPARVRRHAELQREQHLGVHLGCRLFVSVFEFESLGNFFLSVNET